MDEKKYAYLKIQAIVHEHLIASMFAAQQRGMAVTTDMLREMIASAILDITQDYYQTDQTASPENAEVEAQALWVEVTGNHHTDKIFGLIQQYLQRG